MSESQKKLNLAILAGELLLKNGAEIFRVQQTVTLILETFEITDYNVYVVSNGIFTTVNENMEDSYSSVRHVPLGSVNLGKIAMVNQISREVCEKTCSMELAFKRLETCSRPEEYTPKLLVAACGMGSACFCYLFGGKIFGCLFAFFMGLILQIFLNVAKERELSKFITSIIGSTIVTFLSALTVQLFPTIAFDSVVIGAIISLVPGVAFTTSIRDFFNGDYLSGGIHLIDALLTAICIAVGVAAGIQVFRFLSRGIII
ncbi:MAG: threonine/serine exporter ThrE family protein [Velocimicrobium sp.]